jgi:hypothetical protein
MVMGHRQIKSVAWLSIEQGTARSTRDVFATGPAAPPAMPKRNVASAAYFITSSRRLLD